MGLSFSPFKGHRLRHLHLLSLLLQLLSPSLSSSAASTEPDTKVDLSAASTESETRVEPVVPPIAYEEEEEEDMVANLRAAFKERQRKHLSESITVIPLSSRRPCSEILYPWPILAITPVPAPSAAAAGSNPSAKEATHPEPKRPPLVQNNSTMTPLSVWLPSLPIPKRLAPPTGRR